MEPNSEILEISSEEDCGWDDRSFDNLDWIYQVFNPGGCETEDSDGVEFVGEKQSSKAKLVSGDDSDDDCTVLDGDPDNPVASVNRSADESDELLIVGEKGQLACRDYPHPRHLCAKYPFSSTPHDTYCDLCHCYVCDSPAPCCYWGTGVSPIDHCHSTDKEEIWQIERKSKRGALPLRPAEKLPVTNHSMTPSFANCPLASNQMQLRNRGSVVHSVSSPPLHACPSMNSFPVPRSNTMSRNRHPYNLRRLPTMPGTNHLIQRERNHVAATLGPQLFKRPYVPTVSQMNRQNYGSSDRRNRYTSQLLRNQHTMLMQNVELNMGWQDFHMGSDANFGSCQSSSQPITVSNFSGCQSYGNSQPQLSSQPIPQSADYQTLYQHGNPAPALSDPGASAFNSGWIDPSIQSIQTLPAKGPQTRSVQPTSNLQPAQSLHKNGSPMGIAAIPLYAGDLNPGSSDFCLEKWLETCEHELNSEIAEDMNFVDATEIDDWNNSFF